MRHDHAYVGLIAEISALVQNNKTGSIFIFDRATGKPLVPIVERMYGALSVGLTQFGLPSAVPRPTLG